MEAYHLTTTHPEAVPFNGDAQTQYDVWANGNCPVGRNAGCSVTPSMHAAPEATVYDAGVMFAQAMHDWHYPDGELPTLDPKRDIRAQLGDWHRAEAKRKYGRDLDLPEAVMMDSMLFHVPACLLLAVGIGAVLVPVPAARDGSREELLRCACAAALPCRATATTVITCGARTGRQCHDGRALGSLATCSTRTCRTSRECSEACTQRILRRRTRGWACTRKSSSSTGTRSSTGCWASAEGDRGQ